MHRKRFLALLVIFTIALTLSGCSFFNSLFGLNKDDPVENQPSDILTIYTLIGDMSKALTDQKVCTAAEATFLVDAANAAVGSALGADSSLQATDLEDLIPVATGGSVAGLGTASFSAWGDPQRIVCVNAIVESFVKSLNGKFVATGQARSARGLSDSAVVVEGILAGIAKAAIAKLPKTGIVSAEGLAEAAGGIASTMIASLGGGGVNRAYASPAIAAIAGAAVRTLEDSGFSKGAAIELAVTAIAKGAVSAIASVDSSVATSADYPALASAIAKSAAAAIGAYDPMTTEAMAGLVGALAKGAAEGVAALSMGAEASSAMAQGLVAGSATAILSVAFVDASVSGASLLGAITQAASTALGASANTAITVGAAEGAVASKAYASGDAAAIKAAIRLGGGAAVLDADVAAGIDRGDNQAPTAKAGADAYAKVGELVKLSGTASDGDGDALAYAWSFAQRPAASGLSDASISGSSALAASFTPDVGGSYILSLKASDPSGASAEAFVAIVAVAETNSAYQGITAEARLASAKSYMDTGDWADARDALLVLATYYPETSISAEATQRLAACYKELGDLELAILRYNETIEKWPDAEASLKARLELAWLMLDTGKSDMIELAEPLFKYLADGARPHDVYRADALRGSGVIAMKAGDYAKATELLLKARDAENTNVWVRYYSQSSYADSLFHQGQVDAAITAILLTVTDPAYCRDEKGAKIPQLFYKTYTDQFNGYVQIGRAADAKTLLQKQLDSPDAEYTSAQGLDMGRMLGRHYGWDGAKDLAAYTKAIGVFDQALKKYSGTEPEAKSQRDWIQVQLGQCNQYLADLAVSEADKGAYRKAANAAYDAVIPDLGSSWGSRQAGEAMMEKAVILLWQEGEYDAAEAIGQKLLAQYPSGFDRYPVATMELRMGDIYSQRGYAAQNASSSGSSALFNKALFYYLKVKPANFPDLGSGEWFFAESARGAGACYYALGQYDAAIAQYGQVLANPSYPIGQKAQAQLGLAEAYAAEASQAAGDGDFTGAMSIAGGKAANAFKALASADYQEGGAYLESGRYAAQAYVELGRLYANVAQQMLSYGKSSSSDEVKAVWQSGYDCYAKVKAADFPALAASENERWIFREALSGGGRCLEGTGRYADARAMYSDYLAKIADGSFPASDKPEMQHRIGRSYQNEAERLPWLSSSAASMVSGALSAISEYEKVYALGKALDDGNAAAWARNDAIWSYKLICNSSSIDWPGSYTDLAARDGYIASAKAVFDASGAFTQADGSTLVERGMPASGACRALGWMNQNNGSALRSIALGMSDASSRPEGWLPACLDYQVKALAWFTQALGYPGVDADTAADSRYGTIAAHIQECGLYLDRGGSDDGAKAADAFAASSALLAELVTDKGAYVQYYARALRDMGWACIDYGSRLVGLYSGFKTNDAWQIAASLYFNTALASDGMKGVDGGNVGTRCAEGLAWIASHKD